MIAAVADNGVIGADGKIPWRISSDMAFFRKTTLGKPIVMGRKQFETVGKPLPGRTNIVVSRQRGYQPDGVLVINELVAAIHHAKTIAEADAAEEVMIIGGGQIYAEAMALADRLYVSHVALSPAGDIVFPAIDTAQWSVLEDIAPETSPRDGAVYRITVYQRRAGGTH